MTQTNALYGGLPINVVISSPGNSAPICAPTGTATPAPGTVTTAPAPVPCKACGTPCLTSNCSCHGTGNPNLCAPVNPGNGITNVSGYVITVIALEPIPAFRAVVMGVGGIKRADRSNPKDEEVVIGVTMNDVVQGQPVPVMLYGVAVCNVLSGTGGWNFVLNKPVFLGHNGELTQVDDGTGFTLKAGFALSQNTALIRIAQKVVIPEAPAPGGGGIGGGGVITIPYNPSVVIQDVVLAAVGDLTIVPSPNTVYRCANINRDFTMTLMFSNMPAAKYSEFKVILSTDGQPHVATVKTAAGDFPINLETQVGLNNVSNWLIEFAYDGASNRAAVTQVRPY